MALRHSCPNNVSVRCLVNQSGRGRKRCPGCGAAPRVEEGWYGLFRFDPENRRYTAADAMRRFETEGAAGRAADRMNEGVVRFDTGGGGFVVRFVRERIAG